MQRIEKLLMAILLLTIASLFLPGGVLSHVEDSKEAEAIGLDQKLGQLIPLDLTFLDENGHSVTSRELIHAPTILALVYLHCPNVCSLLLQNTADVLNRMPAEPGKDYNVLSVSFDETEKPDLALQRKEVYLQMITKPFPRDAWRFLTGDKENIHKLTEAVGFHFKRVRDDFEHPVALIVLAPDGRIVRYLYGAAPLPYDLKLALVEASQGRIGPAIAKVVQFCFSYDPKANKLVFNLLRVTGTVTLLFALTFVAFLLLKGKKQSIAARQAE
jgi:protein SCO1/2